MTKPDFSIPDLLARIEEAVKDHPDFHWVRCPPVSLEQITDKDLELLNEMRKLVPPHG